MEEITIEVKNLSWMWDFLDSFLISLYNNYDKNVYRYKIKWIYQKDFSVLYYMIKYNKEWDYIWKQYIEVDYSENIESELWFIKADEEDYSIYKKELIKEQLEILNEYKFTNYREVEEKINPDIWYNWSAYFIDIEITYYIKLSKPKYNEFLRTIKKHYIDYIEQTDYYHSRVIETVKEYLENKISKKGKVIIDHNTCVKSWIEKKLFTKAVILLLIRWDINIFLSNNNYFINRYKLEFEYPFLIYWEKKIKLGGNKLKLCDFVFNHEKKRSPNNWWYFEVQITWATTSNEGEEENVKEIKNLIKKLNIDISNIWAKNKVIHESSMYIMLEKK